MNWDAYWQWLTPLTVWLGRYALLAALVGSAAGLVLWLAGSRFSRSLVTLLAVSVGAGLGMHLPGWFGWGIDGMGLATGAAMVLGLTGYLLHNTWVGATLCLVLSLWAGALAWLVFGAGTTPYDVAWPAVQSSDPVIVLAAIWRALPGDLPRAMPCAIAGAVTAGVAASVVSAKFARVLTYSLAGLTVLVVAGSWALHMSQPNWIAVLPTTFASQLATLLGLVLVGVLIQWRLTPGRVGGAVAVAGGPAGRTAGGNARPGTNKESPK